MAMVMAMVSRMVTKRSMKSSDIQSSQSRRLWAKRWCFGLLAVYLAYSAFNYYFSLSLRRVNPAAAWEADPRDAAAIAAHLNAKLNAGVLTNADAMAEYDLRAAVVSSPLNRSLVRFVGIQADLRSDPMRAFAAMSLSSKLSRRDPVTQMWLGEFALRRNSGQDALLHFHTAMTIRPELQVILIRKIGPLLEGRDGLSLLQPYLSSRTTWLNALLAHLVVSNPSLAVRVVQAKPNVFREDQYNSIMMKLLDKVVSSGDGFGFNGIFALLWPEVPLQKFSQFQWNSFNTDQRFGTYSWKFGRDAVIQADLIEAQKLEVVVQPSTAGVFAQRDMVLVGGRSYEFSNKVHSTEDGGVGYINWTAQCSRNGNPSDLLNQRMPLVKNGYVKVVFAVPRECRVVHFSAKIQAADSQFASRIVIDAPHLTSAN